MVTSLLEKATRGQASNPRWKVERQYRLTASTFGDICTAGPNRDMGQLAHDIFYPRNLDKVPAIKHGRTYEQTAIEAFTSRTGKEVTDCGLFVDPR